MSLVSVIINAYNSEQFIRETCVSALQQSYRDLEVVVFDNSVNSRTRDALSALRDSRLTYVREERRLSVYAARMEALEHCNGEFVAYLDHDDLWHPDKLALQIPEFEDPRVVACCADFETFVGDRPSGRKRVRTYRPSPVSLEQTLDDYKIGFSTIVFRRSAMNSIPNPPPDYWIINDLDMVTHVLSRGMLAAVPLVLAGYRIHPRNLSRDLNLTALEISDWLQRLPQLVSPYPGMDAMLQKRGRELQIIRIRGLLQEGKRREARAAAREISGGLRRAKYRALSFLPC